MSLSATQCTHCGTSNISSAKFCGGCGQPAFQQAQASPNFPPQVPNGQIHNGPMHNGPMHSGPMHNRPFHNGQVATPTSESNWQEMAGLVCGVLSMFMLGIFAAAPGLYFSWTAISQAKAKGTSTRLGTIGLVLNILGLVATVAAVLFLILIVAMQLSVGSDPYGSEMYGPTPYAY